MDALLGSLCPTDLLAAVLFCCRILREPSTRPVVEVKMPHAIMSRSIWAN